VDQLLTPIVPYSSCSFPADLMEGSRSTMLVMIRVEEISRVTKAMLLCMPLNMRTLSGDFALCPRYNITFNPCMDA
jgi:hypothetical protein